MPERIIFHKPVMFLFDNHDATKKQKHNALLTFFTRKKTLAKRQPRIVYTVFKKIRTVFFQRFTFGKPKTFSRTT
jgi:hypothetical protein